MNKVICDVCGTGYPETANQCPICGSARVPSQAASADNGVENTTAYTYVKGGRFSKKNVKARGQKGKFSDNGSSRKEPEGEEKTSKGLIAVVIILLLAIVATVIYIGLYFFDFTLNDDPSSTEQTGASNVSSQPSDESTLPSDSGAADVTCSQILLSNPTLELINAGDKWTITAQHMDADGNILECDGIVTFTSSDDAVATVSATGEIVAVGNGEAVITVTCGSISAQCNVHCNFGNAVDPSDPSDPSTPSGPAGTGFDFAFNTKYIDEHSGKYDITLKVGDKWTAYVKSELTIEPDQITWISDDPDICTVENGKVTILATGKTEIHAQYNGETVSCIVRCIAGEESSGDEGGDEGSEGGSSYTINKDDVTISVDEPFTLTLKDADGKTVEVTWSADHSGYVKIEGNKITGVKSTSDLANKYVLVSVTVDGETYSCKVRVK